MITAEKFNLVPELKKNTVHGNIRNGVFILKVTLLCKMLVEVA